MDPNNTPQIIAAFSFIALVMVGFVVIAIIPYWKIYVKTGQSGAMALLQLIPLVNIVMLYVLAFSEWPIERELRDSKNAQLRS